MTSDTTVTLAGMGLETVLFAVLVGKRVYRTLPAFAFYTGIGLCFGAACLPVARFFPAAKRPFWMTYDAVDALLYLWVLAEVGKNLIRYNRAPSPRRLAIIFLFLLAAIPICFLVRWTIPLRVSFILRLAYWLLQALSVLEVAAVLALIWWGSLQNLRWPDRELRVVTGLGFSSLVELGVAILHFHGFIGSQYHWLDLLPPVGFSGVLAWWLLYFAFDPGAAAEVEPREAKFAASRDRSRKNHAHRADGLRLDRA